MNVFKAYDVRGIYPTEINEELMERIGRSFAKFVKGNKIAVGYDMRTSSKSLFKAFVKGVLLEGKTVLDFGLTSTPMSYFASCYLEANGTAMITASHNPKEYNGVKLCLKNAIPVCENSGLKEIENIFVKDDFSDSKQKGQIVKVNINLAYENHLKSLIKKSKSKLKIIVDPANGMGAKDFNLISKSLPATIKKMYFKLDGSFPNHDANPMIKGATNDLKKRVIECKANLGISFDGDADRAFFIDEKGNQIPSDYIIALISEDILLKQKGIIFHDLRCSKSISEFIKLNKGNPKECRVGNPFIKEDMRKYKGLFAGELSGHFYFNFEINSIKTVYDSGIVSAIHIINILNRKSIPLSELVSSLNKYFSSGEINCKVISKDKVLKKLELKYKTGTISHLDGLKISFNDWWFSVRQSNTEPLLRLILEANTKDLLLLKKKEIITLIRTC